MDQLREALGNWPNVAQTILRLLVVLAVYAAGLAGLRYWAKSAEASGERVARHTVSFLWLAVALGAALSEAAYSLKLGFLPLFAGWGETLTRWFSNRLAGVVGIVALAYLALTMVRFLVHRITPSEAFTRRTVRLETLRGVLASGLRIVIITFALVAILGQLGVNVTALLAGVSVFGLAVSFGAQSLVKDVITGFFILFEDHYGVGDVVRVNGPGGLAGAVEAVSLRTTVLRDLEGTAHILPNSQIATVSVLSKQWARAVMDVQVNYRVPADTAIAMVGKVALGLYEDEAWKHLFLEAPEVLGVQELGASGL
ncbi:MAG TPA: mechanosensitive ion channel family protein, partial [Deinococcales bacterium]|nr:mechanosensitive ion channel family protein [Deinococcales bacterium]